MQQLSNIQKLGEELRRRYEQGGEETKEFDTAFLSMIADLRYPTSRDGSVMDMIFLAPLIAWHLTRCGYRVDPEKRIIKPRKVVGKGVPLDAIEWVDVDAPDDPLGNVINMTMAEINSLPPHLKAEAIRRLGGPETEELQDNPGWSVAPTLHIEDVPDTNDDHWSGRQGDIQQ